MEKYHKGHIKIRIKIKNIKMKEQILQNRLYWPWQNRRRYPSVTLRLREQFRTRGILSPRGRDAMSGDIFGCHDLGGCYWHLMGRGQEAAEIPQCTGQSHRTGITQLKMSVMLRLRKHSKALTLSQRGCFIIIHNLPQ